MHKATFTLRQETPLIHFLHDQPGATLRATELKPKLDKFIAHEFEFIAPEIADKYKDQIEEMKKRLLEEQPKPSSYKINVYVEPDAKPTYFYLESRIKDENKEKISASIKAELNLENITVFGSSPLFVNNDKLDNNKWEEIKLGVMYQDDILVFVSTWDENLLNLIKKALPLLFCFENFGLRQSKGFGGFRSKDLTSNQIEEAMRNFPRFVKKRKVGSLSLKQMFKAIDNEYKNLRNNPAQKSSQIKEYFETRSPKVTWEKNRITDELVHGKLANPREVSQARFIRGLLGLPPLHDYPKNNVKINIKEKNDEIGRFSSPIRFKILDGWLYLLECKFDKGILGRDFLFYKGDDKYSGITMATPSDFDLNNFLETTLNSSWKDV